MRHALQLVLCGTVTSVMLLGCQPELEVTDSGVAADGGRSQSDSGVSDAGIPRTDAGTLDAGAPADAGISTVDSGSFDAGEIDAGPSPADAGISDAGLHDTDAGGLPIDGGARDSGSADSGATVDAGPPLPSWVPTSIGTWVELPNTSIATVAPAPAPAGMMSAKVAPFSSLAIDPRDSRVYSAANGGNVDYSGNEVDRLILETETPHWEQIRAPTAGVSVTNGTAYYADGSPSSRATGYGITVDTVGNRVMTWGGVPWGSHGTVIFTVDGFRIGDDTWDPPGTFPDVPSSLAFPAMTTDPATGNVYAFSMGSAVWVRATNAWLPLTQLPPVDAWTAASAFDSTRNQILLLGDTPQSRALYSVSTGTLSLVTLSGSEAAAVNSGARGAALSYVAAVDQFLFRTGEAGGSVLQINPVTLAVTPFATTGGTAIPVTSSYSTKILNKFLYAPRLKGFIYVPTYAGNAWFLRVH